MVSELLAIPVGFGVSEVSTYATTIYLHRCQTHGSLKLHPAIDWFCRFMLWMTTGQKTKEWVAVHRKHHAHSDEEGDPHSPLKFGFWKVQLTNFLLYRKEAQNPETIGKYARDIKEDGWDKRLFNYGLLGPILGLAILWLLMGWKGALIAGVTHFVCYVMVLTSCVNAIGHYESWGGYQNYDREDASNTFNYKWLAWLTGGEGLHNNHHGDPRSAKFNHRADEFDPGWMIIRWLQRHDLAYDVRLPRQFQA